MQMDEFAGFKILYSVLGTLCCGIYRTFIQRYPVLNRLWAQERSQT